jgi:PAS domain S-box-containing protein
MSVAPPPPLADLAELQHRLAEVENALGEERRRADALNRIAAAIGAGGDLQAVVQAVVDGGVELTGAAFGAFFYNDYDEHGELYTLYTLSGAPRSAFERYPMPRNTEVFAPTFRGEGVIRSDDITADPRYGHNAPNKGMPQGHLPVRSYLAVPVIDQAGAVLGGLFFGHPEPGRFPQRLEHLMLGVAGQAAVAIENVRLRRSSQQEMNEREQAHDRLQFALQSGRLGAWELDVETGGYEASDLCKANYGREADAAFGFEDLLRSIHPHDVDRVRAAMDEAIGSGAEYDIEYRIVRPDGQVRWLHVRGRAAQTAERGGVRRMAGVSLDVTERKQTEERMRLLLNELNHRVKNTLAAVLSISAQTLRNVDDLDAYRQAFEARILALSHTHNLLTAKNWEAASLHAVLAGELQPYQGAGRFVIESDRDLRLNPKAAVALGMAIHELATNALKYGALSTAEGRVTVRSRVESRESDRRLVIEWVESGGPPVARPTRRGFGARLLEQGLAGELAGQVRLDYLSSGLMCRMDLPMQGLEASE